MRVLLVHAHGTDTTRGGAEHNIATLARGYLERGIEVTLLTAFPGQQSVRVPTAVLHRTDWVQHPSRRLRTHAGTLTARPTRRLREIVANFRPDVVHTHNLPGITTAIWEVARREGVPVVHGLHDYHLLCPRVTLMQPDGSFCRPHPLLCGLRTRRLARWANGVSHVHGPSEYILTRHAEFFGDIPSTVIRHPHVQSSGRSLAPPREQLRTIGFIGALNHMKGINVVLEAVPALRRLGLEVRIAGHGPLRPEVEAAHVIFGGTVAGAARDDFFESCDLGVVPSVWPEPAGPPWALLDWLSAGRPVISSRRGGLAESAALAGVHSVEPTALELVAAVERLLEPEAWKRAVGELAPTVEPGDHERWIDEQEALLREAVG